MKYDSKMAKCDGITKATTTLILLKDTSVYPVKYIFQTSTINGC